MLPLLTERLRIYLHPQRIVVIREACLFKRRILDKHSLPVNSMADGSLWQPTIQTLCVLLENREWKGSSVSITLSGHFLKYRIADWHEKLSSEEQSVLLQHRFSEIYGDEVAGWKIFMSDTGFNKHELACAVDPALLNALQELFEVHTLRLLSVQPFLTAAINSLRRKMGSVGWIITIESGLAHFARFSGTGLTSVRSKVIEDPVEQLALFFERELMHAGEYQSQTPIYLFWPENPGYRLSIPGRERVEVLTLNDFPGFSAKNDAGIAPAVCA